MQKLVKGLVVAVAVMATAALDVDAQSRKPGSSSRPSASRPSASSSKPKFSAPSSTPSSTKTNNAKSKFSAPPKEQPKPSQPKPKYTPPPSSSSTVNSQKPVANGSKSDKARANAEARSERKFAETKQAVAPPKPKYTTPDGKEVKVRTATADAQKIRTLPSTSLKPEVRQQNLTVHVTQHHYHHDYNWYRSQPVVYVGGGYSSAFWWIMMTEWDAERRARWLYSHRYDIEADAYNRGVRDAQVASAIRRMEDQRTYRDPNYTDPDFAKNPSLQYTDDYVQAVYNPHVVSSPTPTDPGAALTVFLILGSLVLVGVVCWGIYALLFKVRWGS